MRIIYDIGAHEGENIEYYLKKASKVIAVEANVALCRKIAEKFKHFIAAGSVVIGNCVVSATHTSETVPFWVHKIHDVLSQSHRPDGDSIADFEQHRLASVTISQLVARHGTPYYVKVDIEGADKSVLCDLFEHGIFPPYISSEAHDVGVFSILVAKGHYRLFKIVDSHRVCDLYHAAPIVTKSGQKEIRSFPYHSAGPFGEDLKGPWYEANDFVKKLAVEGFGWKDIHATNQVPHSVRQAGRLRDLVQDALYKHFSFLLRRMTRRSIRSTSVG